MVPGWYGCCWIKWVNELRLVGADEPTTLQMMEFSLRTHQGSIPELARDYEPPAIDLAATPIRVEKRRVDGRLQYRIIGIVWGGDRPVDRLAIRFSAGETPQPFTLCPAPRTHRTWSLWDYRWRPQSPGPLHHRPRAPPIPRSARAGWMSRIYVRRVVIDESDVAHCAAGRRTAPHRTSQAICEPHLHRHARTSARAALHPIRCGCHCTPSAMMRSSSRRVRHLRALGRLREVFVLRELRVGVGFDHVGLAAGVHAEVDARVAGQVQGAIGAPRQVLDLRRQRPRAAALRPCRCRAASGT